MLTLQQLVKNYATQRAVNNVSFSVDKGSIFGLLGPNGAGKSSLLRMVTGITMPDSGQILFNQEPFNAWVHSEKIGYMPEERGLYKKMKVGEQALYLAQLKGMSFAAAKQSIQYWFNKLDMQTWVNKKVEDLSKGMSQKLQFVLTVVHKPILLILDEPFSGLDPLNSEIIKQEIHELANQGTTIIFSTHRMEQVEEICRDIVLINKGEIVLQGKVDDIKNQFKQHQFLLVTDSPIKVNHGQVISQKENRLIVKFEDDNQANLLLSACIQSGIKIVKFEEILPTLNEIFIQQVEGAAARQFETL